MEGEREAGVEDRKERMGEFCTRSGAGYPNWNSAGASEPMPLPGTGNGKLLAMSGAIDATNTCRGCGQARQREAGGTRTHRGATNMDASSWPANEMEIVEYSSGTVASP